MTQDEHPWIPLDEFAASRRISINAIRNALRAGRLAFATRFADGMFQVCPTLAAPLLSAPPSPFQGVYFVEVESFIKIGYADDVRHRLLGIQHANPLPVTPLGFIWCPTLESLRGVEATWHRRFAAMRHRGEWFRATPTLREAITTEAERWPRPKAKRRTPA